MAEYGEWNRKGASLSDATALKEYGVDTAFIAKGINSGDLEYREGSVWGNPYLKVLRGQLEEYIAAQLGPGYLAAVKGKAELRAIRKEKKELQARLSILRQREVEIGQALDKAGRPPGVTGAPRRPP